MKKNILLLLFLFTMISSVAQTALLDVQVRPRFENRNGYKTLLAEDQEAANFISQRSRLNLFYHDQELELKLRVQHINVWGERPAMGTGPDRISLFEAYGQYTFSPQIQIKLGRQVLSYDNQRIFGEVNWAQQAQSHDAALISYTPSEGDKLHLGFAMNAQKESLSDIPYQVNSYKNLQFAWYHLDRSFGGLSFLFLNTGYEYGVTETERDVNYMQTYGLYYTFGSGDLSGDLSGYGQSGTRSGMDLSGFYAGGNLNYALSETWKLGVGAEYLSGTDMDETASKNFSFTPLFGTNHAFNGHMDYFFVGNHLNSVGLVDVYTRLQYQKDKFRISAVPHVFSAASDIRSQGEKQDSYLGTEIDLFAGYTLNNTISVQAGYSQMFGSSSLEMLKGGDADRTQNWAWLMVNFNPKIFTFSKDN